MFKDYTSSLGGYMQEVTEDIAKANELIERLELYQWLKKDEFMELFDVLTDGFTYRRLQDTEGEQDE